MIKKNKQPHDLILANPNGLTKTHEDSYWCEDCQTIYGISDVARGPARPLCPTWAGVLCNKCGEDCVPDNERLSGGIPHPYGLQARFSTGFYSEVFSDGDCIRFNMCEACIMELMKQFKLPGERRSYLQHESSWWPFHVKKEEE